MKTLEITTIVLLVFGVVLSLFSFIGKQFFSFTCETSTLLLSTGIILMLIPFFALMIISEIKDK